MMETLWIASTGVTKQQHDNFVSFLMKLLAQAQYANLFLDSNYITREAKTKQFMCTYSAACADDCLPNAMRGMNS